jgi:hypothetical protein
VSPIYPGPARTRHPVSAASSASSANLADTVQQRAGAPGFAFLARPFGTAGLAVILARITCGLRCAAMLEANLCKRAERSRELTVAP